MIPVYVIAIIAIIVIPFITEWFSAKLPGTLDGSIERTPAAYLLVPLMGAIIFGGLSALTGRPYMSLVGTLLFFTGITKISNMKYDVLKDPFSTHDLDNFRNLYFYPEFYISYIGWPTFLTIVTFIIAAIGVGAYFEPPYAMYQMLPPYMGWPAGIIAWFVGINLLRRIVTQFFNETTMERYGLTMVLQEDMARFGLFPTVLLYRLLLKANIDKIDMRERGLKAEPSSKPMGNKSKKPGGPSDIIAIQGESYFDLERLFKELPDSEDIVWPILRDIETLGVQTGQITVPCWGAYTMQTEFSFLSTLRNDVLGIDRINPYMRLAQRPVDTIVKALRDAGYRTICIHPAKKEFFRRSDVMGNLGFDEFIGLEEFAGAKIYGKYISDKALGDKIDTLIEKHHANSKQPLFIFAITIESHGPWAPERIAMHTDEKTLRISNPTGNHEFSLYQRHMENMLKFYKRLSTGCTTERPRVVALYGDHMPAFGPLFDKHGFSDRRVDYLLWNSDQPAAAHEDVRIENFGKILLAEAGLSLTEPDTQVPS